MKLNAFVLVATIWACGTAAVAAPSSGTPKERASYRHYIAEQGGFKCPRGTSRMFAEEREHPVEFCITPRGLRHGYYVRWQKDAAEWQEVGRFEHGKRHGTWHRWTTDGRTVVELEFHAGKLLRNKTFRFSSAALAQK